ncbi:MAG: hypothetical protein GY864_03940 [Desulfobacterales bacterium]|nr:hypothetical protein [Desulfobacterales bacterium]
MTTSKSLLLISIITAIIFSIGIRFLHLEKGFKKFHHLFYSENKTPLMTTRDAYFHLKLTDNYISHQDTFRGYEHLKPGPTPLLVLITNSIQKVTRAPLEKIAFYLPPILASLMILVYYWLGMEFGGTLVFLLASIIGMGSYYWYTRTCLGRFDTDMLIPFFVYGISYLSYKFSSVQVWKKRLAYLFFALLMAYLFHLWWRPAHSLSLFLLIFPYSLSLFFQPTSKVERFVKMSFMGVGFICLLVVLLNLSHFLPGYIMPIFAKASDLLRFVVKDTGSLLPGAADSITELKPTSWTYLSERVAGHSLLLIMSLVGLVLLINRHYKIMIPLIFPFFLGLASIFARRFLIYFIPFYALGLAYFLKYIGDLILKRLPLRPSQLLFIALCLTIIFFNSAKALNMTILPKVTSNQVTLAKEIRKRAGPQAVIWSWWDYGYFLQYYGQRRTMMDGGGHHPELIFITAFPLTAQDPILAKNWMKFFAVHGVEGLRYVDRNFHDLSKTINFLKRVFARPETLDSLVIKFGLKDKKIRRNYLFPDARVYLYLPHDLFEKAYWWYYFGSWESKSEDGSHATAIRLKRGQFRIDEKKGLIGVNKKMLRITDHYSLSIRPSPRIIDHKIYQNNKRGLTLIRIKEKNMAYLVDDKMRHSLFAELFFMNPLSPPSGFQTVKYIPLQGGVWKVE